MEKTANFKVGDKVRVTCKDEFVPEGTVLTVARGPEGPFSGGNYYFVEYPSGCVLGKDLELVSSKPTKNQRITALESEVATLTRRIEALEQVKSYTHTPRKSVEVITPIGANQARKAIIDEAKAFVADAKNFVGALSGIECYKYASTDDYACGAEFVVNTEKRTVVALLKTNFDKIIKAKGIAKCAPDDVFNADIGKAIALGRALGLGVERFEQAVKPTELAVGQTIKYTKNGTLTGTVRKVAKVTENQLTFDNSKTFTANFRPYVNDYIGHAFDIIEDTEAQY